MAMLADLIAEMATGSYVVTRRRAAVNDGHGRRIPSSTPATSLTIVAAVVPASGRDLLRLPELRRANETRTIFTDTLLQVGDQAGTYDADLVTMDGEAWEVQHVETWGEPGTEDRAYKAVAQRVA